MKKATILIVCGVMIMLFVLSGCTRSQSTPPATTPTEGVLTLLPEAIASQTAAPTIEEAVPTEEPPAPTEEEPEPTVELPTQTPTERSSSITLVPSEEPEEDAATPTPTGTAVPAGSAIDPVALWGNPTRVDPMNSSSFGDWKSGGVLPNTDYLQISLQNDQMFVTGKKPLFSTWYFSWPTLKNFYQELTVDTMECAGQDAYGLIVRGPQHGAGVSFGYILTFTCDGGYALARLDSADPFTVEDLILWTKSGKINAGANQRNVIGIKAEGQKLTIYANGYQIAEVSDATYPSGRYGLYVRAADLGSYTFRPIQISYWDFAE